MFTMESKDITKETSWNVISEKEFKNKIETVFNMVSESLTHTLGPYGSTTIIEQFGEMHITKDGWNVLKSIKFSDPVMNNILMLLLRISAQVVIKVGDGSTSSIVAANCIMNEINKHKDELCDIRPKEFIEILNKYVVELTNRIYNDSHKINKETYEEIYKIAQIATNGDVVIPDIITDIYRKTDNPSIEYMTSKTDKTTYEIIDGYRGNITYIDNIFTTNDDGTCVIDNPYILMFDHKIDLEVSIPIINHAIQKAQNAGVRLVVVAPNYDKFLLDYIRKNITLQYKSMGTSIIIYCRASLVNNISHQLYNDFSVMCGAQIISEQYLDEITLDNIDEYIGNVDHMVINDKTTLITGFKRRNENMFKKIVDDATDKYNKALKDNENRGIVDIKLNEIKNRVTKLHCKMGIIQVGGNSTLEKKANFDLVEDAIKACESAYNYGYNVGCSLVIPQTINRISIERIADGKTIDDNTDLIEGIIFEAFIQVFKTILKNKYNNDSDDSRLEGIINNCIDDKNFGVGYDLINEQYSTDIINSCETDIEILKATASIISLLTSSNQYISIENTTEF